MTTRTSKQGARLLSRYNLPPPPPQSLFVTASIIGTPRGLRGRGVGDYTSLNGPYSVLIMDIKAPPKGPYDYIAEQVLLIADDR